MDFIDKKVDLLNVFKEYIDKPEENKDLLFQKINKYKEDMDFKDKELFQNIFLELEFNLDELNRKELKQRYLMIETYIY